MRKTEQTKTDSLADRMLALRIPGVNNAWTSNYFLSGHLRIVHRDGISRTFNAAVSYVSAKHARDPFDSRYGTDTNGVLPLSKFKIDSPNAKFGWRYETSVLIAAGLSGFRKLIGVVRAGTSAYCKNESGQGGC